MYIYIYIYTHMYIYIYYVYVYHEYISRHGLRFDGLRARVGVGRRRVQALKIRARVEAC